MDNKYGDMVNGNLLNINNNNSDSGQKKKSVKIK